MEKSPRVRQWSADEKAKYVRQFKKSGASISYFARHHNLGVSNLRNWIDRYSNARQPGNAFVELKGFLPQKDNGNYLYELELVSGHTLRLRRDFDSQDVQTLVAVLNSDTDALYQRHCPNLCSDRASEHAQIVLRKTFYELWIW